MNSIRIVLIHGFAASKGLGVIPLLFDRFSRTHQTYSFDLPGHGSSQESFESITFPILESAIESFLDSLDGSVVLVGHSMGGALSYRIAARNPKIEKLVLLAPGFSIRSRFLLSLRDEALENGTASFEESGRSYRVSRAFFESRDFDPFELAPRIRQPTLIVAGDLDYTIDRDVCSQVARALPSGSFVSAVGEGHDLTGLGYWSEIESFLDTHEE